MIIFIHILVNIENIQLFLGTFSTTIYSLFSIIVKTVRMPWQIIATHTRNINENIYQLGYIFFILMTMTNIWWKNKIYYDNQRYRMHTMSISVDWQHPFYLPPISISSKPLSIPSTSSPQYPLYFPSPQKFLCPLSIPSTSLSLVAPAFPPFSIPFTPLSIPLASPQYPLYLLSVFPLPPTP